MQALNSFAVSSQGAGATLTYLKSVSSHTHVARTRQHVVLADAALDPRFGQDRYVAIQRPASLLCMPLLNQGALSGVVYLENNLTHGAFTQERLQVVSLLGAQAALSFLSP